MNDETFIRDTLSSGFSLTPVPKTGTILIHTPFLSYGEELVEIHYKPVDGGFALLDYGRTLSLIEQHSSTSLHEDRRNVINSIAKRNGFKFKRGMIGDRFIKGEDLKQKLFALIQCIIQVSFLAQEQDWKSPDVWE